MGGLGVKKKEKMPLRKSVAFAGAFPGSACDFKQMYSQTPPSQAPQLLLFRNCP